MYKVIVFVTAAVLVAIMAIGFYKIGEALEFIEIDEINRHEGKKEAKDMICRGVENGKE